MKLKKQNNKLTIKGAEQRPSPPLIDRDTGRPKIRGHQGVEIRFRHPDFKRGVIASRHDRLHSRFSTRSKLFNERFHLVRGRVLRQVKSMHHFSSAGHCQVRTGGSRTSNNTSGRIRDNRPLIHNRGILRMNRRRRPNSCCC